MWVAANGNELEIPRHRMITLGVVRDVLQRAGLYDFAHRTGVLVTAAPLGYFKHGSDDEPALDRGPNLFWEEAEPHNAADGDASRPEPTFRDATPEEFEAGIGRVRQEELDAERDPAEVRVLRISDDGKAGYAIGHDGEVKWVWSTARGYGTAAMTDAAANGGHHLSCFDDGKLVQFYKRRGYEEYHREPNHDGPGKPDVVWMRLPSSPVRRSGRRGAACAIVSDDGPYTQADAEPLRLRRERPGPRMGATADRPRIRGLGGVRVTTRPAPDVARRRVDRPMLEGVAHCNRSAGVRVTAAPAPAPEPASTRRLVHYSPKPGLTVVDPAFTGSGQLSNRERQDVRVPTSYYYLEGTPPERLIRGVARNRYEAELPEGAKLLDLNGAPGEIIRAYHEDGCGGLLKAIRDAGYFGFYNSDSSLPGVVQVFEALPVTETDYSKGSNVIAWKGEGELTEEEMDDMMLEPLRRKLGISKAPPPPPRTDKPDLKVVDGGRSRR